MPESLKNKQVILIKIERPCHDGLTLVELIIALAILGILTAITVPNFISYIDKGRVARAITELKGLEKELWYYEQDTGNLPDSLDEIGYGAFEDPWGNPYQYLRIRGGNATRGQLRKDRFMVPVNTDFDLYSKGKDGDSETPFTVPVSHDDVVRCNDGGFVGLASSY